MWKVKPGKKMYEELQHLAAGADMAAILGKIKELVPAYTGWPREGKGRGLDSGFRRNDGGEGNS